MQIKNCIQTVNYNYIFTHIQTLKITNYEKIKTRIGILVILLTVFTMFASCLNDDDEPKDKQKTVTLYVSATTGERTGMTGTPHECMLIKEKGEKTLEPCEFNGIKGFTYEKGYEYELLATKNIYANPPADGSSYDYTLIKVVSKMAKGNE